VYGVDGDLGLGSIDFIGVKEGWGSWPVTRRHWCYSVGIDSLFQITTVITPNKERPAQPGVAFEDTAFRPGFEIAKI
jgi:hypothetical protein